MCELFGVSSDRKLRVDPYLKVLMAHSVDHPHGWGMAISYGGGVNVEKEPKTACVSDYVQTRLSHPVYAKSMMAHIRLATRGIMAYENCHPFVGRDVSGRAWTLAHNGTIFQSELLDAYREEQEGSTDSERILCHVLHEMNAALAADGSLDAAARFRVMDRILLDISENNKVNLMVFDGEVFYVHTNMRGTLYRTEREGGTLFATVPLDDGVWEPVPMMRLLAYRDGRLIAEGTQHNYEYRKPDSMHAAMQWSGL